MKIDCNTTAVDLMRYTNWIEETVQWDGNVEKVVEFLINTQFFKKYTNLCRMDVSSDRLFIYARRNYNADALLYRFCLNVGDFFTCGYFDGPTDRTNKVWRVFTQNKMLSAFEDFSRNLITEEKSYEC